MTQITIYSKTLPRIAFFLALLSSVIVASFLLFSSSKVYANITVNSSDQQIINYACSDLQSEGSTIYQGCINNTRQRIDYCKGLSDSGDQRLCRQSYVTGLLNGQNQSIDGLRQATESARQERLDAARQPGNLEGDCKGSLDPDDCGITALIRQITDALLVIVGIVVVMMVVIGGIQYSAAGSNPQAVAAAKKKISQALFALVIYLFMGALLEWLIPGGLF